MRRPPLLAALLLVCLAPLTARAGSPAPIFADNFTRANSATIGNGWSDEIPIGSISSNVLTLAGTSRYGPTAIVYRPDETPSNAQARLICNAAPTNGGHATPGVWLRWGLNNNTSFGYRACLESNGGATQLRVELVFYGGRNATEAVTLAPALTPNATVPVVIWLTTIDGTITAKVAKLADPTTILATTVLSDANWTVGRAGLSSSDEAIADQVAGFATWSGVTSADPVEFPGSGTPPAATVSAVTVAPATATVQGGATQQFSATVAGTNSPAQTVTWSATAGSISSAGLLTAPGAISSARSITVTAASTVDPGKAGTATVTVPAAASTGGNPGTIGTGLPQPTHVVERWSAGSSDLAGLADGAGVASWTGAGGIAATQATAGSRPTLFRNAVNGHPAIRFAGSASLGIGRPAAIANAVDGGQFTVLIAYRSTGVDQANVTLLNASASYQGLFLSGGSNGYTSPQQFDFSSTAISSGTHPGTGSVVRSLFTGGSRICHDESAGGTNGGPIVLGGAQAGGLALGADLFELVVWDCRLTAPEVLSADQAFRRAYGVAVPSDAYPDFLIADGDSITTGRYYRGFASYPAQLAARHGRPLGTWTNLGISGQTMPQMIAGAASDLDPFATVTGKVLSITAFEEYNQAASSVSTKVAAATSYATARKLANPSARLVMGTGTVSTGVAAYSGALVAVANPPWDQLARIDLDPSIGSSATPTTIAKYFGGDGFHPNPDGYALLAGLIGAKLDALPSLSAGPGSGSGSGGTGPTADQIATATVAKLLAATDVEGAASGRTLAQTLRAISAATFGKFDRSTVAGAVIYRLPTGQEQWRYSDPARTNIDTTHAVAP